MRTRGTNLDNLVADALLKIDKGRFGQVSMLRFKWDAAVSPGKRVICAEAITPPVTKL